MPTNYSTQSKKDLLTRRREPYQFMMWLGLAGSTLLFLSLMALYFYRKTNLGWFETDLPRIFWLSTLIIFSSSITLFEAQLAFRSERYKHYRICLGLTFIFGVSFVITQAVGWLELITASMPSNPPGSNSSIFFICLITGLHFLHLLGGLAFLGILLTEALRNNSYIDAFVYSVNAPNILRLKLLGIYWHFIGALWLVLFFAMLFYQTPPVAAS